MDCINFSALSAASTDDGSGEEIVLEDWRSDVDWSMLKQDAIGLELIEDEALGAIKRKERRR